MSLTTKIYPGDQVFLAIYYPDTHSLSTTLSDSELPDSEPKPPVTLPPEYSDFADVFSERNADKLPPNRGHLDHSIPLEEGAKPQVGPIYNLSEVKLEVLKEYIETHLAKGFIRPSTSPFGAPVLFVKKPHGRDLRLVVDYRALNRYTIKNRPLYRKSSIVSNGQCVTPRWISALRTLIHPPGAGRPRSVC
jgi:hypothetical protein